MGMNAGRISGLIVKGQRWKSEAGQFMLLYR
jgi:hypothetical protein